MNCYRITMLKLIRGCRRHRCQALGATLCSPTLDLSALWLYVGTTGHREVAQAQKGKGTATAVKWTAPRSTRVVDNRTFADRLYVCVKSGIWRLLRVRILLTPSVTTMNSPGF